MTVSDSQILIKFFDAGLQSEFIRTFFSSFEDDPELDQEAKEKSLLSSMLSNSPLSPSVETSPNREKIGTTNNREDKFQYLKKAQFEFVPEHNEVKSLEFHILKFYFISIRFEITIFKNFIFYRNQN